MVEGASLQTESAQEAYSLIFFKGIGHSKGILFDEEKFTDEFQALSYLFQDLTVND